MLILRSFDLPVSWFTLTVLIEFFTPSEVLRFSIVKSSLPGVCVILAKTVPSSATAYPSFKPVSGLYL